MLTHKQHKEDKKRRNAERAVQRREERLARERAASAAKSRDTKVSVPVLATAGTLAVDQHTAKPAAEPVGGHSADGENVIMLWVDPRRVLVKEQVRTSMDEEEYQELLESIRDNDQEDPCKVHPVKGDPDHDFQLVNGHRRHRAATELGRELLVFVYAKPGTDVARIISQFLSNRFHSNLVPIDEARMIQDLLDLGQRKETIASRTGMSAQTLDKRLALLRLPGDIQAKMEASVSKKERLGAGVAYEVSKLRSAPEMRELVRLVEEHGMTISEVEAYVRDKLKPRPAHTPKPSPVASRRAMEQSPSAPSAGEDEIEAEEEAMPAPTSYRHRPSDRRATFESRFGTMARHAAEYADLPAREFKLMFAPRTPQDFRAAVNRVERVVSNSLAVLAKLREAKPGVADETNWELIFKLIFGDNWREILKDMLSE